MLTTSSEVRNVWVHKWESKFKPPYRYMGCTDMGKPARTCNICGTGIRYVYILTDANGVVFIVGCDCIEHYGDSELISLAERDSRHMKQEAKDAAARARNEARMAEIATRESAERVINGGLTNYELESRRKKAEQAAALAVAASENQWIIDAVDNAYPGNFVMSMRTQLRQHPISSSVFSDRVRWILSEIVANWETGKKRGKVFDNAVNQAHEKMIPGE